MSVLKLMFAGSNPGKYKEFCKIFEDSKIELVLAPEKLEIAEGEVDFFENAQMKAKAYFDKYQVPTISDDSGLVVEALPDELGVNTAYFGGEDLNIQERCSLLLKKLKDLELNNSQNKPISRDAYFTCIICCYLSYDEIYFFEGRLKGIISKEAAGEFGFGYDPVFIPQGEDSTLAQKGSDWKNKHSHRAKALNMALDHLKNLNS